MKSALLLVGFLLAFVAAQSDSDCSTFPFGSTLEPYSLFVLEQIIASNSEVQGRIAAGGDVSLQNFVVGSHARGDLEYALVSGGTVSWTTGYCQNGGITANHLDVAYVTLAALPSDCCNDPRCTACNEDEATANPIDFVAAKSDLVDLSDSWSLLEDTDNISIDFAYRTLTLTCAPGESFNVFNEISLNRVTTLNIECSETQTVLINYLPDVSEVTFTNNLFGGITAGYVIHHFASSVNIATNLHGYVFAPRSNVAFVNGIVNGAVIANSFTSQVAGSLNSGQVNLVPFAGCAPAHRILPNFVIFMTDDMGYGDLSCNGNPVINTPNIDQLAYTGKRLNSFYSTPMCTPTRTSILTGRDPIRTGAYNSDRSTNNQFGDTPPPVFYPVSYGMIPASEVLISNLLTERGYTNGIFGKWHLGTINSTALPLQRGFQRFWGIPYSTDQGCPPAVGYPCLPTAGPALTWVPVPLYDDNTIIEQPTTFDNFMPRMTSEALSFIEQAKRCRKPFFAHINYVTPHVPLFTAPKFAGTSVRGLYGDVIEEIDSSVGEIVRKINLLGLRRRTLIVFLSDNGAAQVFKQAGGSSGLFKAGKGTTWEGGVRVPSLWNWPGRIDPATIDHSITSVTDIFTTFASLARADIPTDRPYDGLDLSSVLFNNSPLNRTCITYYSQSELTAVRCGAFKIHYATKMNMLGAPVPQNPPLLFNVNTDPSEMFPLDITLYTSVIESLNAYRASWVANTVPGPAQFQLYDTSPDAYQPCCNIETDCVCLPPNTKLGRSTIEQAVEYSNIVSPIVEHWNHYSF